MRHPALLSALVTAALVSGVGWALGEGSTTPSASSPGPAPSAARAAGDVVSCDGGRQKSVRTRATDKTLMVYAAQDPRVVPGTSVRVAGPSRGKDTFIVTFSAEAALWSGSDPFDDYLEVVVLLDGKPVGPDLDGNGETAFTGVPDGYGMHSLQSCLRVGPGRHNISLRAAVRTGADVPVSASLDDYLLRVERFD